MSEHCTKCKRKLNFFNKPIFGGGKLKDGNQICHPCFRMFTKVDLSLASKIKNYTLEELEESIVQKTSKPTSIIKTSSTDTSGVTFGVTTSASKMSAQEQKEYDDYTKKYPKWFGSGNTVGLFYKKDRVDPLPNGQEETVHYKSDRFADLFGRGKDCSYLGGYGKIYNRVFDVWYVQTGSKEQEGMTEYNDIAADNQPPFFIEDITGDTYTGNELTQKKGYKRLYNGRDHSGGRTWYAGLKSLEFTGINAAREKQ